MIHIFWQGCNKGTAGVGVFIAERWIDCIVNVVRVNERIMYVKLVIGKQIINIVSAYAPQVGLSAEEKDDFWDRLQTTQPTSGGAVTADKNCCANCVEPSRPQQWGPDLPFFGHAGHADPLDGWRCCSQKRVMSRPIQVRQH